jgi:CRP-like cAMP-binding protein
MDNLPSFLQIYITSEEKFESGAIVIEEGSTEKWAYVILEGRVKVTKRTKAGTVTLDTLKQGAIVGELALFGKLLDKRSASVIAADGPVTLGLLDAELLRKDYDSASPRLRLLLSTLVMRLKAANEKVVAFAVAANQEGPG